MDESTHDERMRHLQRLAYGAVASDTERAAAVAELESLRREPAVATDAAAAPPGVASARRPVLDSFEPQAVMVAHRGGDPARPLTWAIAAGTAALLLGVAVGWGVGARMPAAGPGADTPVPPPDVSLDVGSVRTGPIAVADSAAYAVFERPATPADIPALDVPEEWKAEADPRLLVTMPDGTAVYAAKPPEPEGDMCVVIVVPDQPGLGLSCTKDGTFEDGALRHQFWHDRAGTVSVVLYADGSVQVGGRSVVLPIGAAGG